MPQYTLVASMKKDAGAKMRATAARPQYPPRSMAGPLAPPRLVQALADPSRITITWSGPISPSPSPPRQPVPPCRLQDATAGKVYNSIIDNVSVVAVPEPSICTFAGVALLSWIARRRKHC